MNLIVWIGYIPVFLIFMKIIVLNMEGILGFQSPWIAPLTVIALIIVIIIIRIFLWGENSLASGIITIIAYMIFLTWAQITAPKGPRSVPMFGEPMNMSAFLILAFTIHSFMPQNMLKNPEREQYQRAIGFTFLIGVIIYIYVALASFGISFLIQR